MNNQATDKLKQYFGFSTFRPGQEAVIEHIFNKQNTLAIMPTGGGKSLCYQIPSLVMDGTAIIISPLISLMKDQVDALTTLGIEATFINSSLDSVEQEERLNDVLNGKYKMVYVAPERFQSAYFINVLNTVPLSLIAFDEAHCISQWGHDFRPSYRSITQAINGLSQSPPIIALTATATNNVIHDIKNILHIESEQTVVTGFERENLKFNVIKGADKKDFISNYLREHLNESGIIYTPTRKLTEQIYSLLSGKGINVERYHAGMSEIERKEAQTAFINDDVNVMVATNAFGMGINKSNVRYIIHYSIPMNIESYYQEAGRAGRDGVESECYLLFSAQDIQLQKFLIEQSSLDEGKKKAEYQKLQDMISYCHTNQCLQHYILDYFGNNQHLEPCGKCSNCRNDGKKEDMTKEAQMILSCVKRMNERFGVSLTAKVLKGSKSQKVMDFNFHKLSTYGLLKQYTEKEIVNLINYLVADGYLTISDAQFPILKLTTKSVNVLKDQEKVWIYVREETKKVQKNYSEELFEVLRELRKTIANDQGVPPYLIFSDATLKDFARFIPETESGMLQIKGVGEKKYEQFGEEFLNKIKNFREEHGNIINHDQKNESTSTIVKKKDKYGDKPNFIISYELFLNGKTIEDIAKDRDFTTMTIENHLFRAHKEGHELNLDQFFTPEVEQMVLDQIDDSNQQDIKLKPIKENLPEEISYTMIRAILTKHALL